MRSIPSDIINWATRTRQCLGWQEALPEFVHLCWKVVVPTLEVVARVLAKLAELAKSGVTVRDLLGLDKEAVLLESVLQLLLDQ